MMNASALAFVVAGSRWAQADGQIMYHTGDFSGGSGGQYRPRPVTAALSSLPHPERGHCERDARMSLLYLTFLFPCWDGCCWPSPSAASVSAARRSSASATWACRPDHCLGQVRLPQSPPEVASMPGLWRWMTVGRVPARLPPPPGRAVADHGVVTRGGLLHPPVRLLVHAREEGYSASSPTSTSSSPACCSWCWLMICCSSTWVKRVASAAYLLIGGFTTTTHFQRRRRPQAFVVTRSVTSSSPSGCSLLYCEFSTPQHSRAARPQWSLSEASALSFACLMPFRRRGRHPPQLPSTG